MRKTGKLDATEKLEAKWRTRSPFILLIFRRPTTAAVLNTYASLDKRKQEHMEVVLMALLLGIHL